MQPRLQSSLGSSWVQRFQAWVIMLGFPSALSLSWLCCVTWPQILLRFQLTCTSKFKCATLHYIFQGSHPRTSILIYTHIDHHLPKMFGADVFWISEYLQTNRDILGIGTKSKHKICLCFIYISLIGMCVCVCVCVCCTHSLKITVCNILNNFVHTEPPGLLVSWRCSTCFRFLSILDFRFSD
jgi:hypothetical protein